MFRKSFVALVLAVCLCVNLSAVAFAYRAIAYIKTVDGKSSIGVFPIKDAPSEIQDFWINDVLTSGNTLIFSCGSYDSLITFVKVPDGVSLKYISTNDGMYKYLDWTKDFRHITFSYSSTDDTFSLARTYVGWGNPDSPLQLGAYLGGDYYNSTTRPIPSILENRIADISSPFDVIDDLPRDPPPVEPTPTPPPIDPPSPPDVVQPPIDYPTFPKYENTYVPYDTTIWNEFANYVRSAVGNSANTGFTLLSIVLGILVAIKVVHMFAGTHSKHGG